MRVLDRVFEEDHVRSEHELNEDLDHLQEEVFRLKGLVNWLVSSYENRLLFVAETLDKVEQKLK